MKREPPLTQEELRALRVMLDVQGWKKFEAVPGRRRFPGEVKMIRARKRSRSEELKDDR